MLISVIADFAPSFDELSKIDVSTAIYFDGFSRDKFINSILKIADAIDLCIIMWKEFTESSQDLD